MPMETPTFVPAWAEDSAAAASVMKRVKRLIEVLLGSRNDTDDRRHGDGHSGASPKPLLALTDVATDAPHRGRIRRVKSGPCRNRAGPLRDACGLRRRTTWLPKLHPASLVRRDQHRRNSGGRERDCAPQIPDLTSVLARNRHAGAASTREDDLRRLFFEPIVLGTE